MVQTISIDESFEKLIKIVTPLKPLFNIPNMSNEMSTQLALLAEHPEELKLAVDRIKELERRKKLIGAISNVGEGITGMSVAAQGTRKNDAGQTSTLGGAEIPVIYGDEFK